MLIMGFNGEQMIKQKEYSDEKYKAEKRKSFGVAKRSLIMFELMNISITNVFISLGLFIILVMGTSAIPYFFDISIDFGPETFVLRGGFFVTLSVVFLIILTISGLWYAIGYKKLEIMCIHLDGKLYGALEVNKTVQRDNLANNLGDAEKCSSVSGPIWIINHYLNKNGIKTINTKIFKIIKLLLILGQIISALLCLGILYFLFKL